MISEADAVQTCWNEEEEGVIEIYEGDPPTFPRATETKSGPAITDR